LLGWLLDTSILPYKKGVFCQVRKFFAANPCWDRYYFHFQGAKVE
jgi:hypothetical protein